MLNITTTYTTNDKGEGRIVAKGAGKQRTIKYDHSVSKEANHGTAAAVLALVLIPSNMPGSTAWEVVQAYHKAAEAASHETVDNGKHRFTIPV